MAFGFGLKHESQHAHGRGEDETAADAPARIDGITVPTQGAEVSEDPGLGSGSGDSASSAVPEVPAGGAGVPTGDAAVPEVPAGGAGVPTGDAAVPAVPAGGAGVPTGDAAVPAGSAGVPADPGVPVVLAGGAGVPKDSESPISSGDPGVSAGGAGVPKEQYTEVIQPFVGDETARILYTAPPANKFDSILAPSPQHLSELNATHISAWFGDHKVLEDVSLRMPAGQVTALIGPSGCGKSTFLRILNRMHELVPGASLAGEVRLDGKDIYDADERLTDARRDIGMVFQRPNPFPAMSIYDNVVAGLKLTGTKASRDEKDVLVESSLRRAGLWNEVKDRLAEPGGGLSGGQQQRLCIARSLAIKPKVLLMDEPCSALDPTSTRVIEETMTEMKREVTIVIVTHNMQQAERVSQQCAFFLATLGTPGQIVEYGDTDAMFHDPQDKRTRDYVSGRFG